LPKPLPHDLFLDIIPVSPEGFCSLVTSIKGFIRSRSTYNIQFLRLALKLLGLEVMLIAHILKVSNCKGRVIDVAELSIFILRPIEVDHLF
jgi:hypothetical protein